MSVRNSLIKQNRIWRKYLKTLDIELADTMEFMPNSIISSVLNKAKNDGIPREALPYLLTVVDDNIKTYRIKLNHFINRRMSYAFDYGMENTILALADETPNVLKIAIGTGYLTNDGRLIKYNRSIERFKESKWWLMKQKALEALSTLPETGEPLSARVWDVARETQKLLKRTIRQGVYQEENAANVASKIKKFLKQPTKLTGKALADYHPGVGVYKNPFKNALRLSRTEEARAYAAGMKEYAKDKKWITGHYWQTGSGEPCPECQDLNGTYFKKGTSIPLPSHPQCFCYLIPAIAETYRKVS